jgi:hypothetical protein
MADIPLTIDPSYVEKLPAETTREYGYTHRVRIPASAINSSSGGEGDTVTLTLLATPAKYIIERVHAYVKTAFAYATGSATLTVSLGITGSVAALIDARDALTAGALTGNTALTDSSGGTASNTIAAIGGSYSQAEVRNAVASLAAKVNLLLANSVVRVGTTATALVARFTCQNTTGGEPDNISAGELVVLVKLVDLTDASA